MLRFLFPKKEDLQTEKKAIDTEVLKRVRKIHIRSKRAVNDVMAGEYQSAFKGRGMEFDTVREYFEGDDPRQIDWNVTARMGHPYVKNFVEERELTVVFMVDVSASGQFAGTGHQKKEVIAELCGVLAFNAMKKNDRVGLVLFSDQVELYLPPKKGRKHVLRLIRELLLFQPKSKGTSIGVGLEFMRHVLKKKAVLFLISDLMDSGFEKQLQLLNKRHELVAVEVFDPLEKEVPDIGLMEVSDLETGQTALVDTSCKIWRRKFLDKLERLDKEKKRLFRKNGIDHLRLRTDQDFEHELSMFFHKRSMRRW